MKLLRTLLIDLGGEIRFAFFSRSLQFKIQKIKFKNLIIKLSYRRNSLSPTPNIEESYSSGRGAVFNPVFFIAYFLKPDLRSKADNKIWFL